MQTVKRQNNIFGSNNWGVQHMNSYGGAKNLNGSNNSSQKAGQLKFIKYI